MLRYICPNYNPSLVFDSNTIITPVTFAPNLGILFDNHLTFNDQITAYFFTTYLLIFLLFQCSLLDNGTPEVDHALIGTLRNHVISQSREMVTMDAMIINVIFSKVASAILTTVEPTFQLFQCSLIENDRPEVDHAYIIRDTDKFGDVTIIMRNRLPEFQQHSRIQS